MKRGACSPFEMSYSARGRSSRDSAIFPVNTRARLREVFIRICGDLVRPDVEYAVRADQCDFLADPCY